VPSTPLPPEERPRERLKHVGPGALTDAELLAVLLGTASVDPLREMIARAGGLAGLERLGFAGLRRSRGIGPVRAAQLHAALEIGRRVATQPLPVAPRLTGPAEVFAHLGPRLAPLEREVFFALALDTRHRVRGEHRIAEGHLGGVEVHPRELFRPLIREAAAAAILVHNHPSGDPAPSAEDVALTERMRAAGDLVGIPVLDHVVVARGGFSSLMPRKLDR
jgi:DNA repair protein RadC